MRGWTLVWAVAAVTTATSVFVMKHEVRTLERRLGTVNRQILANESALHVLHAEWAYLDRPERVTRLGRELLSLEPTDAKQIVTAAWLGIAPGDPDISPVPPPALPRALVSTVPAPVAPESVAPEPVAPQPVAPPAAAPAPPPEPVAIVAPVPPSRPQARPRRTQARQTDAQWIAGLMASLQEDRR